MTAQTFRKKPIVITAIQWTGDNEPEVCLFADGNFEALPDEDRANSDDPAATAQVYDRLHSTWVLVQTGDWILRGIQGEFYPCRSDVFDATYEPVDNP